MTGPPKPLGMSDFFALEAGEYLERLDALLATGDSPSADELVRLARALRGSALMANQHAIARTAAALEAVARAVREGRRAWDPQTKQLALRGVDDLKIFVRRAPAWSDADTAKAEALSQELEQLAGRPSAQVRAAEALGLDAGARAFVAREGAAIASALDRAAQALRANPLAHDPLQHVLRALQPLRGLAAVNDLPPLPDLLVVSIGTLYYSDSGPHIVSRGIPAPRPSTLGRLELVSHGDHLRQAADSLERAPSATQRELRAHTLGTTFRALANAGGGVLADRVAQFAIAAREAVASGVAVTSPAAVAAELRRAGEVLARSSGGDEEALAAELDAVTAAIRAVKPGAPAPALVTRPVPPSPPSPPPPLPRPAAPRADQPVPETADLVGSWTAYQRLTSGGIGAASLDELLAGGQRTAAPPPHAEPAVVDVRNLLYRGDRALARAQELRAAAKQATGDSLRTLVEEVCDLVALALEPNPGSTSS